MIPILHQLLTFLNKVLCDSLHALSCHEKKNPENHGTSFQVTSLFPIIHSSQVLLFTPKRVKRTMPSTLHEKALEYGTSSHFFLPVKLWCLCENEHRFKLTGWFYTNYHNIDYRRSQWWQAVGMATKFKCLCKFIKGLWIRSWEIQTGEDLKQRGRGRQGDRDFFQGLMLSHPLDDTQILQNHAY